MKEGKKHLKIEFERLKTWIKNVLVCLHLQQSLHLCEGVVQANQDYFFSSGNYLANIYWVLFIQLHANTSQQ